MSKLFRVMVAAGLIAVMLTAWNVASVWAATPPEPIYGTADVDGDYGEWNLSNDFFANMYQGGDPNKDILSKLYLRYDCSTETLYALVRAEDDVDIEAFKSEEHWIRIDENKKVDDTDGDDGTPPDFAWIARSGDYAQGWEASAPLAPGIYTLNVHTQVYERIGEKHEDDQTSAVKNRAIDLLINCGQLTCERGDMVGAATLVRTGKTVSWDITNTSSHPLIIESIELNWPSGNGKLITVKLDGITIFNQERDPTSTKIDSGWTGSLADRTIEAGTGGGGGLWALAAASNTETLELVFQNQAGDPTLTEPYFIAVWCFGEGCYDEVGEEAKPTAVTLSTFAARSSAGGLASPLWLGLAGLTLAAGSLFWVKRRAR
ncbi:MAG: hypothetical protein FJ014_20430 [Chloroflexi bacterium]|nr:hypothetical protein [Chloroflexota bacterium]